MRTDTFLEKKNRLIDGLLNRTDLYEDDVLNRTLNFVSANLGNFLPGIAVGDHESIFRNILLNQKLSILEHQFPEVLDSAGYEGDRAKVVESLKKAPAIICTFHMGSNRLLNHFLAASKISYALVIGSRMAGEEGEEFRRMYAEWYKNDTGKELEIIVAHERIAALRMLRAIKSGKSLLLYIDGNTGAGDDSTGNGNRCKINFLSEAIYARKGIAYVAHMANVPIFPVVSYRKDLDNITLQFWDPIFPKTGMRREVFAITTTQRIYDLFAPVLIKYPQQWECWIYLHTIVKPDEFTPLPPGTPAAVPASERFVLNRNRYGFFNIGEEFYLLDKRTYTSYEVDDVIYKLLRKSLGGPIEKRDLDPEVLNQFIDNQVFIGI